jgi:large subunit ribosomal protein L40e
MFVIFGKDFLRGKVYSLEVESQNTTIGELHEKVREQTGIPCDDFKLIFAAKRLEESRTVGDYNIEANSTIAIMQALRGFQLTPVVGCILPHKESLSPLGKQDLGLKSFLNEKIRN